MTLTIRDISEARREEIEALTITQSARGRAVLVAVAEQLDLFERRATAAERTHVDALVDESSESAAIARWDISRACEAEHQVALQIWEAAYTAAGGVVER